MKHTTNLSKTPDAWKPLAKVAALVLTLLLSAATSEATSMLLTLTGDVAQTTPDNYNPTADALAGTTNHGFAYSVLSPTSPLPGQTYTGPGNPNGYHGPNLGPVTIAYTFGTVVSGDIIFDLYGRSDVGAEYRDNGLVFRLYNGDWITPVFTSAPFSIPDSAPYYGRFTTPVGITSDRVSITRPDASDNYFTLMEIRAVVPEPSIALLAIVGGTMLLRRRRGGS